MKGIIFGDPHLQMPAGKEDLEEIENRNKVFNSDAFDQWLSSQDQESRPEYFFFPGDIIDRVPSDRKVEGGTERDIRLAREVFLKPIDILCGDYDMKGFGVGGNHDYDIQSEMFEGFERLQDLTFGTYQGEDTVVIGSGAESFDLSPEVSYRDYTSGNLSEFEEILYDSAIQGSSVRDVAERIGVDGEDQLSEFSEELDAYWNRFDRVSDQFEEADLSDKEVVYMNHAAPFNTELDILEIEDGEVYNGSIADKTVIDHYNPDVAISGHTHRGGIAFPDNYDEDSTVLINAANNSLVEIEVGDNGIGYNPLN